MRPAAIQAAFLAALALAPLVASDYQVVLLCYIGLNALVALGLVGARLGGACPWRPTLHIVVGGIAAMAATMAIGSLFGAAIG